MNFGYLWKQPWSYCIYKINGHSSYMSKLAQNFLTVFGYNSPETNLNHLKKKKKENLTNLELFSAMGCAHGNNEKFTVVQVGAPISAPSNK